MSNNKKSVPLKLDVFNKLEKCKKKSIERKSELVERLLDEYEELI